MVQTNPVNEELDVLDTRIEEVKNSIKMHDALKAEYGSDSFKLLILNGYMEEEAVRLTSAITTPDGMKREHIQSAIDKLVSIRHLRAYLARVELDAMHAEETLEDLVSTKNDIKFNPEKYIVTDEG